MSEIDQLLDIVSNSKTKIVKFKYKRDETISALTKQNFEVKCEPILYFDDSELEQYFKI